MKRLLALLLVFAMLFSFSACGEEDSDSGKKADKAASSDKKEEAAGQKKDDENADGFPGNSDQIPAFHKDATIEETVLYSQEGLTITAKALEYTVSGVQLKLEIKNESKKDYSVTSGFGTAGIAVNGFMVQNAFFYPTVKAGKTVTDRVTLPYASLQMVGIDAVAQLRLGLEITDGNFENTKVVHTEICTSLADSYTTDPAAYSARIVSEARQNALHYSMEGFVGETAYDQKGVKILSQCLVEDELEGLSLLLELENTADEAIHFSLINMAINDLKVQDYYAEETYTMMANTRGIMRCVLSYSIGQGERKSYGIESIDKITYDAYLLNTDYELVAEPTPVVFQLREPAVIPAEGTVLYESDTFRLVFKKAIQGDYTDLSILLLAENKRDHSVFIVASETGDFKVNGEEAEVFPGELLLEPGQCGAVIYEFYDLAGLDIKKPEDLKTFADTLEVLKDDVFFGEVLETVEISYSKE